jgi:hypothetical protein
LRFLAPQLHFGRESGGGVELKRHLIRKNGFLANERFGYCFRAEFDGLSRFISENSTSSGFSSNTPHL